MLFFNANFICYYFYPTKKREEPFYCLQMDWQMKIRCRKMRVPEFVMDYDLMLNTPIWTRKRAKMGAIEKAGNGRYHYT